MLSIVFVIKFHLKMYYQNVRGLRTKTEDCFLNFLNHGYNVIVLTESWLNNTIFDHELIDQRYNIFRRDRASTSSANSKKDGGGVLIATLKKHEVLRKVRWESSCEDLCISLKFVDGQ